MSTTVAVIAGCVAATVSVKAIGPLALGGRDLPGWFTGVIVLLAPALLAALVATQALASGDRWVVGPETAGVLAGGVVAWRWGSVPACVLVAAGLTALLRAVG